MQLVIRCCFFTLIANAVCVAQPFFGPTFTYQGHLELNGVPVNGTVRLDFLLFDGAGVQIGNPAVIIQQQVTNGDFTALVNATAQFGATAFNGEQRWLEIRVDGEALAPRQELTAVPFAQFAAAPWITGGGRLYYNGGNVGIGTDNPQARLHVAEGTSGLGVSLPGLRVAQNSISPNFVAGYSGNDVAVGAYGASVTGGGPYIQGGNPHPNRIFDRYCTIGGGAENGCGSDDGNPENTGFATISGGNGNRASGSYSTIAGGTSNTASADYSTVCGGSNNAATGSVAIVIGGAGNVAAGVQSLAGGRRAKALHSGSFVWADNSNPLEDVVSTADNQWIARCAGGVKFFSDQSGTSGVALAPGSGSWSSASDRDLKRDFRLADKHQILDRLSRLPVYSWSYRSQDDAIRHLGPTAQDFYSAFQVGEDNRHIAVVDADGVCMLAIQALHEVQAGQANRLADLQTENDRLRSELSELMKRVSDLESARSAGTH